MCFFAGIRRPFLDPDCHSRWTTQKGAAQIHGAHRIHYKTIIRPSCLAVAVFLLAIVPSVAAPLYPRAGASSAAPGHPAVAALDGGGWRAAGPAPQWLVVDLGMRSRLHAVVLRLPGGGAPHITLSGSDSGATAPPDGWTRLGVIEAGRAGSASIALDGMARFVRLTFDAGPAAVDAITVDATPIVDSGADTLPPPPAGIAPLAVVESCDLWSSPAMWASLRDRAPRSRPLTGVYDDADPLVIDARIRLARGAGITAFQSCWFRQKGNAGQPVMTEYDGAIRAFADTARLRGAIRWSLLWDNANPAGDGVTDAGDFLDHVAAFWIAAYLDRPNYLRVQGRPVIAIASPERLAGQLGGEAAARRTIAAFRAAARRAGVGDPLLIAVNNASPAADNALASRIGFDAVMAYASPMFTGLLPGPHPDAAQVLDAERRAWAARLAHSRLPPLVTASIGYDAWPWSGVEAGYHLDARAWRELLHQSFVRAQALPPGQPGHALLYVDNWNEYGEGHVIEPSLAWGSSALDVLGEVLRQGR
ncbi:hypothetical protein FHR90_002920 [Endobacter medicaginis]|uniref:F5/8 type C domain-containing protein n=2 Tax=Endobacter medicaginis TaxID=1181271 RepID=A0A839V2T3_9PROT|nr:glycoside hydrolase family 99-like domain-containing protein [Endobacter medicaginis]MBB3175073.1 hypothetical protein [Endobacter medicaginis]MCX5476219.1 glycoside hydrolase family 99-like domain-containing protein [Endobacter medicaginis]